MKKPQAWSTHMLFIQARALTSADIRVTVNGLFQFVPEAVILLNHGIINPGYDVTCLGIVVEEHDCHNAGSPGEGW